MIQCIHDASRHVALRLATLLVLAAALSLPTATPAHADFGIASFSGSATDAFGARWPQAAAHPDVTTELQTATPGAGVGSNIESLIVDLPPGLIGNPRAVPACSLEDLGFGAAGGRCAVEAQVGVVSLYFGSNAVAGLRLPLYNLRAPAGMPALFGFKGYGVVSRVVPRVLPGSYAVSAGSTGISQTFALRGVRATLWGVPADPAHDALRAPIGFDATDNPPVSSRVPPTAFITAPTACSGKPLTTYGAVRSWDDPTFVRSSFDTDFDGFPLITEGCDRIGFTPRVTTSTSTSRPDAPAGLDFELASPQNLESPVGLANAHLRDATVTLPDGLTINPGAADGLEACTDAQLGLGAEGDPTCPDGSKVGTVTARSPLLEETLEGSVFLRSQSSDDPASGEMFRTALVVKNAERGIMVKLPGSLRVNAETGRITASFKDNPQLPVEDIKLSLKSGARAPLATPASCGTKTIDTHLVSWSGHDVTLPKTFGVDCTAGLGGFEPSLAAGATLPVAGAFSPFSLSIAKPDGNAAISGLSMVLPAGLVAKLKGNVGSQVGSVKAFAGPGSNPFMLPGQVFLEGAYGDAPFSLKVVVPAKAGPFDLGEVVVRQKIYVDPITAQVTVVSDPIPTVVKGVPARLQRLEVNVDKPGFMINPTSCAAKAIGGMLAAVDGQSASVNVRFQVGSCSDLVVQPSLALTLSGKGQSKDGGHPAVSATLTQPAAGQANLKRVRVALPLSLALDPDNAASDSLCSFVEGSKPDPKCPASSVVGKATAVSPILNEPLSGPVYFVKNERKDPKSGRSIKTTPKLVIPLVGENGVKLTLTGASTVAKNQLVTTFDNIPDAQVSSFKMDINGGKKGILVVSDADICKSTQIAEQQIDGQNTKNADADVFIQTPSCPLKVLSKKVGKSSVAIKVGGLGTGKVTVTGKGIKKTTKTISKSTVATITAKRTKGKPGKVTVSYDPTGPAKARKTTK